MDYQNELALKKHYRQRMRECICELIAYRTGTTPEPYLDGVHVSGMYPNYRITLTGTARETAKQYMICLEPHFEQPSIIGAAKLEYGI